MFKKFKVLIITTIFSLLGIEIRVACPKGYEPNRSVIQKALQINKNYNSLKITNNLSNAVEGANVLYTDVWSSMGEENHKDKKDLDFEGFTIDDELVNKIY